LEEFCQLVIHQVAHLRRPVKEKQEKWIPWERPMRLRFSSVDLGQIISMFYLLRATKELPVQFVQIVSEVIVRESQVYLHNFASYTEATNL
jgi:hypothetical protein